MLVRIHPRTKPKTEGNLALAENQVMEDQPPSQKTALRDFFEDPGRLREIWASKDVKALRKITIVPENCIGLTTWHKVYNDLGNVIEEHDADDHLVREYQYNDRHLLSKTTFHNDDGPNTDETRDYDKNGNLVTLVDEEGKPTTYTYDKENRQLKATFAGETTEKVYDPIGNLIAFISPEGATGGKFASTSKEYQYDAHNRLIQVEEEALDNGSKLVNRYEYDKNNNLRHIYDPQNNHVEYLYDDLNRKTQHIQHKSTGNLVTQFGYDGVANLTSITDPKGQVFEYEYDLLNRRTDANYPDVPSPLLKLATLGFDYDENNNLTEVVETKYKPDDEQFIDTISNVYDNFDRLDESTRRGLVIDYAYDHNGNRVSVSTVNGAVSYSYTLRNQIKTAVHGGETTAYGYLPDGKLDTITYPNSTSVKYAYHATNRVKSIEHTGGTGVFARYAYTYDKNGNRMSQEEVNAGITETTSYRYDPMSRMKSFTIVGATGGMHRKEYTYEGYNRKTERVLEDNLEVESKTFEYDQTNWLTKVSGVVAGEAYTVDYTFDQNGNTLSKVDSRTPDQPMRFAYDARDKLTQVVRGPAGSETVLGQFDYNHEGDRIRHRFSDRGDVDYYYDDGAVLEEHNAADDSLLAFYQYAERLIALAQPAGKQYYHHDGLGSTIGLTDGAGAVQKTYQLDPWGNIRSESGVSDNRHIFTGKEHDPNTGLVYFGARYYDPEIGRFITQDTYLGEGTEPPSLHRYLYTYSNPTRFIDLHGYQSTEAQGADISEEEYQRMVMIGQSRMQGFDFGVGALPLTYEDRGGESQAEVDFDDLGLQTEILKYAHSLEKDSPFMGVPIDLELFKVSCSGSGLGMECDHHAYESMVDEKHSKNLFEKSFTNALIRMPFIFTEGMCDPAVCPEAAGMDEKLRVFKYHPTVRKKGIAAETAMHVLMMFAFGEAAAADALAAPLARSLSSADDIAEMSYAARMANQADDMARMGSGAGARYRQYVSNIRGKIVGEYSAVEPGGPLSADVAESFSGGRYAVMELERPQIVYRAWSRSQREFGGFWSMERPAGSLQSRMDFALRPEWGGVRGTVLREQATRYTTVEIPAGTRIYVGEVGTQGGPWVGGSNQVLIEGGVKEAWKVGGGMLK